MPRPRNPIVPKNGSDDTNVLIGTIQGTPAQEEEAAKGYRAADLGDELNPYRIYSDKFFSETKQRAMAEKRRGQEYPDNKPTIITSGFDLFILAEKRVQAHFDMGTRPDLSPSFAVCGIAASPESSQYERLLEEALSRVREALYLEGVNGVPRINYAITVRMMSAGIPCPPSMEEFSYLWNDPSPSYWPDPEKYLHLVALKHRDTEEA